MKRYLELSDADKAFIASTEAQNLPESFLAETRARRMGISLESFYMMKVYDRARELADEMAIIGSPNTEIMPPLYHDDALLDAAARRKSRETMEAFREFREARIGK